MSCATAPQAVPCAGSFHDPYGPYASHTPSPTTEAPPVWLRLQRDVLTLGQTPDVSVRAGVAGLGRYNKITAFTLLNPDRSTNVASCDDAKAPGGLSGFGTLSFECHDFPSVGRYIIRFNPADSGLTGTVVDVPLRFISGLPPARLAPDGWRALPLAARLPLSRCYSYGESYDATLDDDRPTLKPARRAAAKLPWALAARMSPDHAHYVTHVFEEKSGWLVMFDHGEFGGGVEWFERRGGEPRLVHIGPGKKDEIDPQNVNQALADGSAVYVLQGISHLGISEGQLAKLWREHDHFTSHVIARYDSEPVAWIPLPDGFLVTTWEAIWHTKMDSTTTLVARLPSVMWYPSSLARASDGTFYVGTRGGVLRLIPTWPDEPRYAADYLWPARPGLPDCSTPEESDQ
ncbi:MAG TPA: hypothetical protein VK745_11385 [Polyangiaceae bacterium]|jgi:hypothetical protein|nr:hypothetical protein [Polyangiaceae bacterium]